MFRPAAELAGARPRRRAERAASSSRRRCARIEELEPAINAFTHVAARAALAAADDDRPGDPRPFAGVPIAIKDNRAGRGDAADDVQRPVRRTSSPPHDALSSRRLRDAGFVIVGTTDAAGVRDPAHHRAAALRPDAQPVGPRAHAGRLAAAAPRRRSRPGWCRSPTATTAAARSGSRPPAAAWSA